MLKYSDNKVFWLFKISLEKYWNGYRSFHNLDKAVNFLKKIKDGTIALEKATKKSKWV